MAGLSRRSLGHSVPRGAPDHGAVGSLSFRAPARNPSLGWLLATDSSLRPFAAFMPGSRAGHSGSLGMTDGPRCHKDAAYGRPHAPLASPNPALLRQSDIFRVIVRPSSYRLCRHHHSAGSERGVDGGPRRLPAAPRRAAPPAHAQAGPALRRRLQPLGIFDEQVARALVLQVRLDELARPDHRVDEPVQVAPGPGRGELEPGALPVGVDLILVSVPTRPVGRMLPRSS